MVVIALRQRFASDELAAQTPTATTTRDNVDTYVNVEAEQRVGHVESEAGALGEFVLVPSHGPARPVGPAAEQRARGDLGP